MNPQIIPIVRPLKKSFVIIALIFLLIGFGIEYGGPKLPFFQKFLPTPQEMAKNAKTAFAMDYWKKVEDKVKTEIEKATKSQPRFKIRVEDVQKDVFDLRIKFPSSDQEMLEDAKDQIVELKWNKVKDKVEVKKKIDAGSKKPPGFGLEADGLYLWIVFFSILISLIGMLITKATVQRAGMIASLINSVIVIFMSIFLIVKAILKLIIMIVLLFFVPLFGPLIYTAIYGTFPKGIVLTMGGLGLLCKIIAAVLLWIGGSQMIRIMSATLLLLTGFLTFFIIELGLGFMPPLFASIADAIIGIIIAIIVIIWSIYMLIGAIQGVLS